MKKIWNIVLVMLVIVTSFTVAYQGHTSPSAALSESETALLYGGQKPFVCGALIAGAIMSGVSGNLWGTFWCAVAMAEYC